MLEKEKEGNVFSLSKEVSVDSATYAITFTQPVPVNLEVVVSVLLEISVFLSILKEIVDTG